MKTVYRIILYVLSFFLLLDLFLDYIVNNHKVSLFLIPSIYLFLLRVIIILLLLIPKKIIFKIVSPLLLVSFILSLKLYLTGPSFQYSFLSIDRIPIYQLYIIFQSIFVISFLFFSWSPKKDNQVLVLFIFMVSFVLLVLWVIDFCINFLLNRNFLYILSIGFHSAYITFIGLAIIYYSYFKLPLFTKSKDALIDPVICVFFSIFSLFLWYPFWIYQIQNQINSISKKSMNPVLQVVFCIIVPFYFIFWTAKAGEIIHQHFKDQEIEIPNNSALYMLLTFFQLGLASLVMIQSDLNSIHLQTKTELNLEPSQSWKTKLLPK